MTRRSSLDVIDEALVKHVHEHQPTTYRECVGACGLNLSTVHERIGRLAERGLLEAEPHHPRTIRLHPSVVVHKDAIYQLEKMP